MLADPLLDMVVPDELTYMVAYDYLPLEEVISALNAPRSPDGDYYRSRLSPDILDLADTVSELRPVKHAFDAGVKAQMGIDY